MTLSALPIFVKLAGRPVMLIGMGEAAEAKRRLLERAGAAIVGEEAVAALAIVAADDPGPIVARLRARGVLVNTVDRPDLCDFTLPAIVARDPVLVAVGTGGVSAGLAAALRQKLEAELPADLGDTARALHAARPELRARFPDLADRRRAIAAAMAEGLGGDVVARAARAGGRPAAALHAMQRRSGRSDAAPGARACAGRARVSPSRGADRHPRPRPRRCAAHRPHRSSRSAGARPLHMAGDRRMSGFAYIVRDGKVAQPILKEALGQDASLSWIHLNTNDERAQLWLGGEARLAQPVIDALTAMETRPRCDLFGPAALVNLRGMSSEALGDSDPLASIRMYAHGGCVFSVSRKQLNAIQPVRKQVEDGKILDPGDLIAAIAQAITEELDPMVAELGDSLDDCEEHISQHRAFDLRRLVNETRVKAIGLRRFLYPQRAALEKLAGLPVEWLADDDRLHLAAAADRAARMAEELESIRERAALTHETLTDLRAELIDQRSLVIAVAAMVFLPLTFVTGLYGMNVEGLWFAREPWAFDAIAILCLAIAFVITAYFVGRHWFER